MRRIQAPVATDVTRFSSASSAGLRTLAITGLNKILRQHRAVVVLAGVLFRMAASLAAQEQPPGLSVSADGQLLLRGKPFRGIGVNYFDAFARTLQRADDTSYNDGFKVLADRRIPFVRFMGTGFWPVDMQLYQTNRASYFQRMDAVVRSAERHDIGLIPSLFWNLSTVPDLMGEPCDQWGNPASKVHTFMRDYTREVVTRYQRSSAIWGWEFGNEFNLAADLPNAATHRPQAAPNLGTPATRTARDELTHDMIHVAFAEFAKEVRRHDPHRVIITGNSMERPSAWHQRRERSWKKDSTEQFAEMLAADNPDPVNVLSVHVYGEAVDQLPVAVRAAVAMKKPLFVGEFGVEGRRTPETERQFGDLLALIEREKVPLAAFWVFDFAHQGDDWNVTATNGRSFQLEAVAAANARLRKAMSTR